MSLHCALLLEEQGVTLNLEGKSNQLSNPGGNKATIVAVL